MPAVSIRSRDALAGAGAGTEPHVNWYTPLSIMSGCRFLATDGKSVNEWRAWPATVVALALTAGARLTSCTAANANNDDGARLISLRER